MATGREIKTDNPNCNHAWTGATVDAALTERAAVVPLTLSNSS